MLNDPSPTTLRPPFSSPLDSWTDQERYDYFRSRPVPGYFPVLDDGETTKEKLDRILENQFTFNHETHALAFPDDWLRNPTTDREWFFMLHKFYYAVGLGKAYHETRDLRYVTKWTELTDSWISTVPLDFLPSRVAGRRIQNWIYAQYYFVTAPDAPRLDPRFYARFLTSLHQQIVHLLHHLDTARNHRTLELSAIFLAAAVFPEFVDSGQWLAFAKREMDQNLQADLLEDGVHCELSTMYHHLVLKNYLVAMRVAKLNGIPMPERMHGRLRKALDFAMHVHRPDGGIPALSDSDSGSFLGLLRQGYDLYGHEPFRYVASQGREGHPPDERSKGFAYGGYYLLRSGWGEGPEPYDQARYLVMDCGPLGAGNHGHFDALSIELAAFGHPLVVDPGRFTYDETGETNWRAWFRGTAAHNTVQVDGREQTPYGPDGQAPKYAVLGPPPDVAVRQFLSWPDFDFLHGVAESHEYPVIHERKVFFVCPDYWIIADLLVAPDPHHYDLRFHLTPMAEDRVSAKIWDETLIVQSPHLLLAQPLDPRITFTVVNGHIAPAYGLKHSAPILQFSQTGTTACFHTVAFPYRTLPPFVVIKELLVTHGGLPCPPHQASAFRISVSDQGREYRDVCYLRHTGPQSTYRCGGWTTEDSAMIVRMNTRGEVVKKFSVPPITKGETPS